MASHILIISNVDPFTAAGTVTVTLCDAGMTKFSLKQGFLFQFGLPAPIHITDLHFTKDMFGFTRPLDDVNTPWSIALCVETDQASIQLRSHKTFAGTLVYLLGKTADHHRDDSGSTANITLCVQPPPRISPP